MSALFADPMMQMMPDFGDRDGNSIMMQTPIILDPINSSNITDMKEFQKQTQQHLQQMMQQQHYQDLGQQQQQQQVRALTKAPHSATRQLAHSALSSSLVASVNSELSSSTRWRSECCSELQAITIAVETWRSDVSVQHALERQRIGDSCHAGQRGLNKQQWRPAERSSKHHLWRV